MPGLARLLSESECLSIATDGRVAAIRWDLLPWAMVLDVDAPASEGENAPVRRVWLVFDGVVDITVPPRRARLPNGIWMASAITADARKLDSEYSFNAFLAAFDEREEMDGNPLGEIRIAARALRGCCSVDSVGAIDGVLSWTERVRLAPDEAMLAALSSGPGQTPVPMR